MYQTIQHFSADCPACRITITSHRWHCREVKQESEFLKNIIHNQHVLSPKTSKRKIPQRSEKKSKRLQYELSSNCRGKDQYITRNH